MPPTVYLDPEQAICKIFEYSVKNGMKSLMITATLEERVNHVGAITVTPFSSDLTPLELPHVCLPTWVTRQAQLVVNYPVAIYRTNLD